MRKLIVVIMILSVFIVFAGGARADIILDSNSPLNTVTNVSQLRDVKKLRVKTINWDIVNQSVSVTLTYIDIDGNLLKDVNCTFTNEEYDILINNGKVSCPEDNNKKKSDLFRRRVQNRCIPLLNLIGTED
jgi:hypothetical protein